MQAVDEWAFTFPLLSQDDLINFRGIVDIIRREYANVVAQYDVSVPPDGGLGIARLTLRFAPGYDPRANPFFCRLIENQAARDTVDGEPAWQPPPGWRNLDYVSTSRPVFLVDEIPDGAVPTFDRDVQAPISPEQRDEIINQGIADQQAANERTRAAARALRPMPVQDREQTVQRMGIMAEEDQRIFDLIDKIAEQGKPPEWVREGLWVKYNLERPIPGESLGQRVRREVTEQCDREVFNLGRVGRIEHIGKTHIKVVYPGWKRVGDHLVEVEAGSEDVPIFMVTTEQRFEDRFSPAEPGEEPRPPPLEPTAWERLGRGV